MSDQANADRLEVIPAVAGTEPEEAPARHVQSLPLTVNLAPQLPDVTERQGRPALDFPGAVAAGKLVAPVTAEMPAGEAAMLLRARCAGCLHFRNEDWRRIKRAWASSPPGSERRKGLQQMVAQLARSVCDYTPGPAEMAQASNDLSDWGTCGALSEERKDLVIVHPEACCPDGVMYYQARDEAAKRAGSAVYDRILRAAQGKV